MKKVLIIEDDGDTLDMLGIIAAQSNVEVVLRSDVLSLTEIKQMNPSLIILDHWIGKSSGGDLCLEIKQDPATAGIPVVMLSALNEIGQIALESHADGSLAKPFDIAEIVGIIETYIS